MNRMLPALLLSCWIAPLVHAQSYPYFPPPGTTYTAATHTFSLGGLALTTGLTVPNGGTGAATLTAHGVLLGEGTGAILALAALAADSILVGQSAADPLAVALSNCGSATQSLSYSTTTHTFGCQTISGPVSLLTGTASSTNGCYPVLGANGTTPTYDSAFTACVNPGLHSFSATTFNGTATNATLAATLTSTSSSTNANFPPLLGNGTSAIYDASVLINPSTHTLTATTFSGALSGNATTATSATSATSATNLTGAITTNASGVLSAGGTKFTASGCTNSVTIGGAIAGSFHSGTTGACTVTITLPTSPGGNGWVCHAANTTTPGNLIDQSGTISTTACTVTGTTVSGDVITFSAIAF